MDGSMDKSFAEDSRRHGRGRGWWRIRPRMEMLGGGDRRAKAENANLNVHRGVGTLCGNLDDDAVRMLPAVETIIPDRCELGRRRVDTTVAVLHNPGCLENLPKSLIQQIQAMPLEDRIDVGDLSLTQGDAAEMTRMQKDLAHKRSAERAKAA